MPGCQNNGSNCCHTCKKKICLNHSEEACGQSHHHHGVIYCPPCAKARSTCNGIASCVILMIIIIGLIVYFSTANNY